MYCATVGYDFFSEAMDTLRAPDFSLGRSRSLLMRCLLLRLMLCHLWLLLISLRDHVEEREHDAQIDEEREQDEEPRDA